MPTYRSSAEAEIRDAVVSRLREQRPGARIIHEINASGQGSNRIDVVAVDRAEIIAVEIKSEKDKIDRLADQMEAMRRVAHHSYAAIHERFLVEQKTNKIYAHYERDGEFYQRRPPRSYGDTTTTWVYPETRRLMTQATYDDLERWRVAPAALDTTTPHGALDMLWRSELYDMCSALHVAVPRHATMRDMTRQLRWLCTGRELTRGICAALMERNCPEADPPMAGRAALRESRDG